MDTAGPKPRRHKGDIMSPQQRSIVMSRIRGRDTGPERLLAEELIRMELMFESHARDLPGTPDFVFRAARVAVFVDGDFWHGWGFSAWRDKLSEKWESKIAGNRRRDTRNHRLLRGMGWKVVRIWEHQLDRDPRSCARRVARALLRNDQGTFQDDPDRTRPGHPEGNLVDEET